MAWVDFILTIGLCVSNTPDLVEKVKDTLPNEKDPALSGTEWGNIVKIDMNHFQEMHMNSILRELDMYLFGTILSFLMVQME
jgi:hypothetical protein